MGNEFWIRVSLAPFFFGGWGWNLAKRKAEVLKIEAKIFEDSD